MFQRQAMFQREAMFPRRVAYLIIIIGLIFTGNQFLCAQEQVKLPQRSKAIRSPPSGERSIGRAELLVADQLAQTVSTSEWLGPLAPVALSPFFGISLLSVLAIWGPEWMPTNQFLESSQMLNNGWLLAVFATLTVMTSLPRLTKVSKPIAVALDRVETYGTIITLILIRFLAPPPATSIELETPEIALAGITMMQAGILSFSADVLLSIAMIINVIVVNSVKFFFEFLVWLTPIPLVDALFETANKTFCAALMGLYAFSPTLATVLNLIILAACAVALKWISRRVNFYRTMLFDPILGWLFGANEMAGSRELVVYPNAAFEAFAPRARLRLRAADDHWHVIQDRWLLTSIEHRIPRGDCVVMIRPGMLTNTLEVTRQGEAIASFTFSRRYSSRLQRLAEFLGAELCEEAAATVQPVRAAVPTAEFR